MSEIEGTTADVIIVGGGLAGASAAVVLGRDWRTTARIVAGRVCVVRAGEGVDEDSAGPE